MQEQNSDSFVFIVKPNSIRYEASTGMDMLTVTTRMSNLLKRTVVVRNRDEENGDRGEFFTLGVPGTHHLSPITAEEVITLNDHLPEFLGDGWKREDAHNPPKVVFKRARK